MLGMMHIQIDESVNHFRVNGVELEKRFINAMFPGTDNDEKALAKYLAIVPFLANRGKHFRQRYKLSEQAAYGVDMAPALVKAIGITEENTIPFMLFCFQQAGEDVQSMAAATRVAFGQCEHKPENNDSNVIQFVPRGHTVH